MSKAISNSLFKNISDVILTARTNIVQQVNSTMVKTYYIIGKLIIDGEQDGKKKAAYGTLTLQLLSEKLTQKFGRGFSVDNLENMRKFYLTYSISETLSRKSLQQNQALQGNNIVAEPTIKQKSETVSRKSLQQNQGLQNIILPVLKLSWSHYVLLLQIENEPERKFYEIEAANEKWSVRELKRQIDSELYIRLARSRNKKKVKELSTKGWVIERPEDVIKDPYIINFLGLKEHESYSEKDLEFAIISKLEDFLKELGKGFLFVSRQQRISFDDEHYYIDLVFYNRILKCFVLIDLKIGSLKHQDLGQMQMYVNYYDEEIKQVDENKTIGIILCKSKKESIVKYTLPKDNKQIFTSKYKTYLPNEEQLQWVMEEEAAHYQVKLK